MAILEQTKHYRPGDTVSAMTINDTIETAIDANKNATIAFSKSNNAERNSENAVNQTQCSISVSNNANAFAETANANAENALNKAKAIEERANNGEFNGSNAVLVESSGMYGLQIIDGNLILNYSGDIAPDLSINEKDELIYNF